MTQFILSRILEPLCQVDRVHNAIDEDDDNDDDCDGDDGDGEGGIRND